MQTKNDEKKMTGNDAKKTKRLTKIQILTKDLTYDKESNVVS